MGGGGSLLGGVGFVRIPHYIPLSFCLRQEYSDLVRFDGAVQQRSAELQYEPQLLPRIQPSAYRGEDNIFRPQDRNRLPTRRGVKECFQI